MAVAARLRQYARSPHSFGGGRRRHLMDISEFLYSKFGTWYRAGQPDYESSLERRDEGIQLLVDGVRSGEIKYLDSVDSPMTRRIKERHGLDEFETNSHWLGSDQEWTCPCCRRTKFEISRVGNLNQILAKLVAHHDHMGDLLEERFNRVFASTGTDEARATGKRLVERIATAFAAHDEVLICEDCNHADSEAKKLVNAAKHFSFTPNQIGRFVKPAPHRGHDIDKAVVREVWEEVEPVFKLRVDLINQVAEAAVAGKHWYEPFPWLHDPVPTLEAAKYRVEYRTIRESVSTEKLFSLLGPQSKPDRRDYSKWRTIPKRRGKAIPPNYVPMLLSNSGSAKTWESLPDDWHCPVCKRAKAAIPYVGDKGGIVIAVRSVGERGPWQGTRVCGSCTTVLFGLKDEVEKLLGVAFRSSYCFSSPSELAGIISPEANQGAHRVLADEAAILVNRCVSRHHSGLEKQ